uniref:XRE family transcriptional regulator n=1 Tax=Staphylococcus epidermidis TaxID=1282 RepID=UPI0011A3545C|nr:XRE family transcriptional regulator [Staphylococcus epidermidis]
MRKKQHKYHFRPLPLPIKHAPIKPPLTPQQLPTIIQIHPPYLTNIQNNPQHPTTHLLYHLLSLLHLSIHQFFFPTHNSINTTPTLHIHKYIHTFTHKQLSLIQSLPSPINQPTNIQH